MHELFDILKYLLPSLIVLLTAWLLLKTFFDKQKDEKIQEMNRLNEELKTQLKHEDKRIITPIRLQAYERLALYLERITPQSLVFRTQRPGQNCIQFQTQLLKQIRDEFEHNLSQQIYVSSESWAMVKSAKEEIVKIINSASANVQPEEPAYELSKRIFESMVSDDTLPTDKALELLKKEIRNFY